MSSIDDDPLQRRITAFWSTIAAGYEAHPGNVPPADSAEYAAWVEAIRDLLPTAPADVLDIGTGTGFVALIAASLGHRVVGVDLSAPMLEEGRRAARQRRLEVRFERHDAVTPELPAKSFDAVVCRHLLWTLREPEIALRHWRELLRPGGRVVAIDGHWFRQEPPPEDAEGAGVFESHYTRRTRSALPWMMATDAQPILRTFERAGFADVELSFLDGVHALAENPPSDAPWYVIVARR